MIPQAFKREGAMNKKKEPSAVDDALFRQVLEGVTPLAPSNRVTPRMPRASSRPSQPAHSATAQTQDTLSDHGAEDKQLTEFMRSGISSMTLRKLRRGQWLIQDSLDLHGLRSETARKLLQDFLHESTQHGLRCVCVIHGKGRHTEGGEGILKSRTRHWLTQCAEVLAFCEAPQRAGGCGAVCVLLKNK